MSRPASDIRHAIALAAIELTRQHEGKAYGATWRDLAREAQVGFVVAKVTVFNMFVAGLLDCVGTIKTAESRRPMQVWRPSLKLRQEMAGAAPDDDEKQPVSETSMLANVLSSWGRAA